MNGFFTQLEFEPKVFNLLMPFIIITYLGIDGKINYFVDVDIFLVMIWCLYVIVIFAWMISLGLMINELGILCMAHFTKH